MLDSTGNSGSFSIMTRLHFFICYYYFQSKVMLAMVYYIQHKESNFIYIVRRNTQVTVSTFTKVFIQAILFSNLYSSNVYVFGVNSHLIKVFSLLDRSLQYEIHTTQEYISCRLI